MSSRPETGEPRHIHHLELVTTLLLALAAVATAWATYQQAHWRSEQGLAGNRSTAARIQATRVAALANRQLQIDALTFTEWVDAYSAGETKLAAFYFDRFRPEFRPAVTAWVATKPLKNPKAPLTPFAMPEYRSAAAAEADRLEAEGWRGIGGRGGLRRARRPLHAVRGALRDVVVLRGHQHSAPHGGLTCRHPRRRLGHLSRHPRVDGDLSGQPVGTALFGRQVNALTARATISPKSASAIVDWTSIVYLARCVSGITSVGLNAVAFVKPRCR